jgi:hypothetical protein
MDTLMPCNTHYMKPNLTEDEKTVLEAVGKPTMGLGWISRRNIEAMLKDAGIIQQTLDRILNRLEDWDYIVRMRTKDGGAVFKLASAKTSAHVDATAYYGDTKGKTLLHLGSPSIEPQVEELILKTILTEGSANFGSRRERLNLQRHAKKRLDELRRQRELAETKNGT